MAAVEPDGRALVGEVIRLDAGRRIGCAGAVRGTGRSAGVRRRLRRRAGRAARGSGRVRALVGVRGCATRDGARSTWCGLVADGPLGAAGTIVGTSSLGDVSLPDERVHLGWTAYAPAVWGTAVNPECKLLMLRACVRRLRLRPGEDPDGHPEHPLAGGDRQARRGPGGGAAPASGAGRRHVPGHRGVLDPAGRVAGGAGGVAVAGARAPIGLLIGPRPVDRHCIRVSAAG